MTENKSRRQKALDLFKPDDSGLSVWVAVEEFEKAGLKWSKNGAARHGAYWDIKDIVWEKKTEYGNAISHLRMNGWRTEATWKQTISTAIKKDFEYVEICSLSLLKVPKELREIDHRFGNKTHPDYIEMYKPENQKVENFQLLFSVLNSAKRQVCKKCCETGVRPSHPELDFVEGDSSHPERFPCKGCFLAEPERYRGKS
jgi:hypothetical protein